MRCLQNAELAVDSRTRKTRGAGGLLLASVLAGLTGCGTDNTAPNPNIPPTTELVAAPRDSSRVPHHITMQWNGRDADGTVRKFDYILDSYAREVATIDQVHATIPAVDDARWVRIEAYRLDLAVLADVLRADPHGDIGAGEFDRWHTFYLRAVDEDDAVDTTPEMRTFQAFTLAPRLWLISPLQAGQTTTLPRNVRVHWNGTDPVGSPGDYQDPSDARWTLQAVQLDGTGAPIGYPNALYDLPDSSWSEWTAWSAADEAGRHADLLNLVPAGPAQQAYVFAVQGRDDGGAITPKFDAATPQANNYAVLIADGALPAGPRLTVHSQEDAASAWVFDGAGATGKDVLVGTDSVTLYWDVPVTSHYGAQTNGMRYGWDITDVQDNNEWTAWGTGRTAAPFAVSVAGNRFYIQARDDLGQITTGVINFHRTAQRPRR